VKFLFPSSIAAYGLPDLATKARVGRVKEHQWNEPTTMYGCNKLYCEHLGRYFTRHYRQLASDADGRGVDFRSIRFPGLISALTVPAAAPAIMRRRCCTPRRKVNLTPALCVRMCRFLSMAMPDAIKALLLLIDAPAKNLSRLVYNIGSFNPTAGQFRDLAIKAFSKAKISFEPDIKRQAIVDSWPAEVDDTPARQDWGWSPDYDLQRAFEEYLIRRFRNDTDRNKRRWRR